MINHKHILRFLTKESVRISIEEYLFLLTVRFETDLTPTNDWKEIKGYVSNYYQQNKFYGAEFYNKLELKFTNWNLMIDKLVLQKYLVDLREDTEIVDFKKLQVTEFFKNKIWTDDKDRYWDHVKDIVTESCGESLSMPNGKKIDYFFVHKNDIVTTYNKLIDYWWSEIGNSGDTFRLMEFEEHLRWYIDNYGLETKFITFLGNYTQGILRERIIKGMEVGEEEVSIYKRR